MILQGSQLIGELRTLFRNATLEGPRDSRAYCPADAWLERIGQFCRDNPPATPPGRVQQRDCEDHSMQAVVWATDALVEANIPEDCGHTFGIVRLGLSMFGPGLNGIKPVPGESHVTNIVRTQTGWWFFERQTGLHAAVSKALAPEIDEEGNELVAEAVAAVYFVWI